MKVAGRRICTVLLASALMVGGCSSNAARGLAAGRTDDGVPLAGSASAGRHETEGSPTPPASAAEARTIDVILTQPLTDSGIHVARGDMISVTAVGTLHWFAGVHEEYVSGPAGAPCPFPGFYAQGLACWSLIGQILPGGQPFLVGASKQFTADAAGELYLGVNDNNYTDNAGSWRASVSYQTQFAQDESKPIIGPWTKRVVEKPKPTNDSPEEVKPLPPLPPPRP